MAKGNSSAGGGSASCSTEQTGNAATLLGGVCACAARISSSADRCDECHAFEISSEACSEIDAIADLMLRASNADLDCYLARLFALRLRALGDAIAIAIDNREEKSEPWPDVRRRLTGRGEICHD